MNRAYRISYHTKPSPALAYYEGRMTVWASDGQDAIARAKRELIRNAPEYRNSIVIDSVK